LGTTVHAAPFQCSVRLGLPTAHALQAEIAATPASLAPGIGVGWNPVQATQFEDDAAATAMSPADFGMAAKAAAGPRVLFLA
jgi:hypothetical protein